MLSIIIVNYLQKDLLLKCIGSIYDKLPKDSFEVIIVNNSREESLAEISALYPLTLIIENDNTGFSKANNIAARQAKGEHLLFLNADTEIVTDFTTKLIEELPKIKNYGVIGLGMQFADGSFQNSFGLFPTILNEYSNRKTEIAFRDKNSAVINARKEKYSNITKVDWVSGAAMFVSRDVFLKEGGFDERFFMYYEDIDICYRLNKRGYTNYYYPFSKIIHHKGENIRGELNPKLKLIQRESQKLYYKLHNNILNKLLLKLYYLLR